jgi:predicted ATPase/DNA-binding SARP family transcriptional activator
MLAIKLLGPLEIEDDGTLLAVPGRMTQALLVRLALDAGTVVSRSGLIDALWGDNPPEGAVNALQVKVSELRRVLGAHRIIARPPGYLLDVSPDSVDAFVATALITRARNEADPEAASRSYTQALEMWRGQALSSVGESPFAETAAIHWHELRLTAIGERARLELMCGRPRPLIAELETVVAEHPLREPLIEMLMLALAADGRQVAALAVYRDLRTRLVTELGIDPSPRLQVVERQVLQQDPTVVLSTPTPGTHVDADNEIANRIVHLPYPVSSFLRRDNDVTAVEELLASHRLVTITGPGGVGKSRLAIEVARRSVRHADGVWFVALESVVDVTRVPDALANSLRARGADAATAVEQRLRTADLLIVLDNCEHLGDELAEIVEEVMQRAPGVHCLATSQRSLGIPGEARWPLAPLPRAAAVELFLERARDVAPRAEFDDVELIERLCGHLDDLPLAIELAAGRCGVLSVQEVTDRLFDRFSLLRDDGGTRARRHRALDATISWSYDLLFPDTQLALQAIAACSGGASLSGFEAIMESLALPKAEVLDLITQLVDRSLIVADRSGPTTRYTALEGVRSFAVEQADRDGRTREIARAHADWVAAFAQGARWGVRGRDQQLWLAEVRAERSNIDAALDWMSVHAPSAALHMVSDLYLAWMMLGDSDAGATRTLRTISESGTGADPGAIGRAEASAAQLLARGGAVQDAVVIARQATSRMANAAEVDQVEVMSITGRVLIHAGQFEEGCDLVARAEARFVALDDRWGTAMAQISIGWAQYLNGQPELAVRSVASSLETLGTRPDGWITHSAHRLLGVLATEAGDEVKALDEFGAALTVARSMGSATDEGQVLANLAATQARTGELQTAALTYLAAQHASRLAGDHVTLRAVQRAVAALAEESSGQRQF